MDIGTAHFTVIIPAGAAGHETVAKIDQAAQGDIRKQDGLLQPNRMGDAGLFFENGAPAHMGAQTA